MCLGATSTAGRTARLRSLVSEMASTRRFRMPCEASRSSSWFSRARSRLAPGAEVPPVPEIRASVVVRLAVDLEVPALHRDETGLRRDGRLVRRHRGSQNTKQHEERSGEEGKRARVFHGAGI